MVKRQADTGQQEAAGEGLEPFSGRLALSPAEAGEALGVNRTTIYELLNRGELRSVKAGSRRLIPLGELRRYLGEVS
jgi:excisionase family DNA binding protein